jgi:hypothetical protein
MIACDKIEPQIQLAGNVFCKAILRSKDYLLKASGMYLATARPFACF